VQDDAQDTSNPRRRAGRGLNVHVGDTPHQHQRRERHRRNLNPLTRRDHTVNRSNLQRAKARNKRTNNGLSNTIEFHHYPLQFWNECRQDPKEKTCGDNVYATRWNTTNSGEGKQDGGNNKTNKDEQGGAFLNSRYVSAVTGVSQISNLGVTNVVRTAPHVKR